MTRRFLCATALLTFLLVSVALPCQAQQRTQPAQLHPMNRQLVQMGLMPFPKYYPEIPRITAEVAYHLYLSGKALFVLISYRDLDLIVGGIHLGEDTLPTTDPNKLPFRPGQVLVVYCP
jgi:hypothetical protein